MLRVNTVYHQFSNLTFICFKKQAADLLHTYFFSEFGQNRQMQSKMGMAPLFDLTLWTNSRIMEVLDKTGCKAQELGIILE
ncbi:hypothetical protein QUF76_12865 [Desulfobacterales bacterium HSG16]|nr:hypothetical protein [Desulfobacterales bacterium HSG16]